MPLAIQTALVMVVLLVIMLAMGVSISVSVGLSSAVAMLCMLPADVSFATSAQRLFAGANSFSLIAIPFFILAGNIMNNGGIAERIVNVAKVIAGRMPGALAQSNVVANMLFGAISGSGAAAAAAMGGTIGPLEEKEGYDPTYSAVVNIASAPTGMLIPPSNLMIVYSTIAGSVSVAALFMGGYLPGILWGLVVMVLAGITAKKRGYVAEGRMPARVVLRTVLDAIPSLLLIVIIIGGILGGVFTATEASAVAVAYATVLAFLYKGITLKDLPRIILDSAKMTGIIALMIGLSSIMSWVMAFTGLPDLIAGGILSLTRNKYVILVLMNVILLVVGTFMDPTPAVLIFTPHLPAHLPDLWDASRAVRHHGQHEPLHRHHHPAGRLHPLHRLQGGPRGHRVGGQGASALLCRHPCDAVAGHLHSRHLDGAAHRCGPDQVRRLHGKTAVSLAAQPVR